MYPAITCSHVAETAPDWGALHTALRPRLRCVALDVLHDEHDAEDAVQEAFLRALNYVSYVANPTAWLVVVLRNIALDQLRRRRVRAAESLHDAPEPLDVREARPDLGSTVDEILDMLPPGEQTVLRDIVAGCELGKVADRAGITHAAARTRLSRARSRVRRMVAN